EHEGGTKPHDLADAAADAAQLCAAGLSAEERAVAVRGAVPVAEPDAAEGDPPRVHQPERLGDLPGCQPRPGRAALVRRRAPLPAGAPGDLRLKKGDGGD